MLSVAAAVRRVFDTIFPAPFGMLNPIYFNVILKAEPLTPDPLLWFTFLVVPMIPLILISYLLVGGPKDKLARESGLLRKALGGAGIAIMTYSFTTWRFTSARWAVYNQFIGIFYLAFIARYIELALLPDPVVDPWMALGRPRWVAAIDLAFNMRHMYLGSVGLDTSAGPPNLSLPKLKPGEKPRVERFLRHSRKKPRPSGRLRSALRHLSYIAFIYVLEDTMFGIMRLKGPDAYAPPGGRPWIAKHGHVVEGILQETEAILLPSTLNWHLPRVLAVIGLRYIPPVMIWGFLGGLYHIGAFICVASGFWETEVWDTDLFDAPLRATSLRDLWGRRWHQLYRRFFVNCTKLTLRFLHIPKTSLTFFLLIYLWSGLLHALGQISSSPAPEISKVIGFFLLVGVGNAIENTFRKVTGRRVSGSLGWAWAFGWQIMTGGFITDAWVDGGWSACSYFPDRGFGTWVAPFLVKHVLTIERRNPPQAVAAAIGSAADNVVDIASNLLPSAAAVTATAAAENVIHNIISTASQLVSAAIDVVTARVPGSVVESAVSAAADVVSTTTATVSETAAQTAGSTAAEIVSSAAAIATAAASQIQEVVSTVAEMAAEL